MLSSAAIIKINMFLCTFSAYVESGWILIASPERNPKLSSRVRQEFHEFCLNKTCLNGPICLNKPVFKHSAIASFNRNGCLNTQHLNTIGYFNYRNGCPNTLFKQCLNTLQTMSYKLGIFA